jgi:hypothetical protein
MVADNQIVAEVGRDASGSGAVVYSDDDVAFTNNQVQLKTSTFIEINVHVTAATLRVVGNRFSEPPSFANTSCYGIGRLLAATANQGSHCLIFYPSTEVGLNSVPSTVQPKCEQATGFLKPYLTGYDLRA